QTVLVVFLLGAVVTRSAGCVVNDLADRRLDAEVRRTRGRPLATGEIGTVEAIAVFVGLGFIAIGLVAMLNPLTQVLAACAVVLMVIYPFMKRILSVPQLILGIAFATAIPMAFAAQTSEIPAVSWLLFAITVVWAVIYDTMYAMCDREDDLVAGIRSSAILFGDADRFVIGALQLLMLTGLLMLGLRLEFGGWYYLAIAGVACLMLYHQHLIRDREADASFQAFLHNQYIGVVVFAGIALDYLYRAA
ncbi:MAG: 4-hydroxybenzoate octaprenyltransferase, partial [Pseudomonadota bacterium]